MKVTIPDFYLDDLRPAIRFKIATLAEELLIPITLITPTTINNYTKNLKHFKELLITVEELNLDIKYWNSILDNIIKSLLKVVTTIKRDMQNININDLNDKLYMYSFIGQLILNTELLNKEITDKYYVDN